MCDRCAALASENERLRRELGQFVKRSQMLDVRSAFRLDPQQSIILAALYNANGRYVATFDLEEALPSNRDRMPGTVKVRVHALRRRLGPLSIETQSGYGYRLTEIGRLQVEEAMESA